MKWQPSIRGHGMCPAVAKIIDLARVKVMRKKEEYISLGKQDIENRHVHL